MGPSISELFNPADIVANLTARNRQGVLFEMAELVARNHPECARDKLAAALQDRENDGSTGIGYGCAIPHVCFPGLKKTLIALGRSAEGLEFGSLDKKPVHLFFMILAPESSQYLKILARISQGLHNENFRQKLMAAATSHEIFSLLKEEF